MNPALRPPHHYGHFILAQTKAQSINFVSKEPLLYGHPINTRSSYYQGGVPLYKPAKWDKIKRILAVLFVVLIVFWLKVEDYALIRFVPQVAYRSSKKRVCLPKSWRL